jgi:hypothetical protein
VPGTAALNLGKNARVTSLSCASPGNCAAGGYYTGGLGGSQAFVVTEVSGVWGKAMKVPGTPTLNRGKDARVTSISCAAAGYCAAGGTYSAHGSRQVFVANEKNGVWGKAITVPGTDVLNVGRNASLTSISCGAPGRCAAGGYYSGGKGGKQAFLVYEKSGVWGDATKVPGTAALNVGGNAQVASVSCATRWWCAAGGTYTDCAGKTQSFLVDGTSYNHHGNWVWRKAFILPGTAAALGVSGFAQLTSISCSISDTCAAAGQYSGPDGNQAFVVSYRYGYWGDATEVPGIASLAGTSSAVAVSCPRVGGCAVTGSDDTAPGVFAAAETDGVWGDAASGNVAPLAGLDALAVSGSAQVTSISCAKTAGTCAIGGSYEDGSSHTQPFVTSP